LEEELEMELEMQLRIDLQVELGIAEIHLKAELEDPESE